MLRHLIFASSLLLLTNACATKIDGLQVTEAFSAGNLKSNAIVSGGVVDTKQALSRADSNAYAGVLLTKIKEEREFAKVQSPDGLIQALGEDGYSALLNKYTAAGLDAATLSELETKLPGVQFIALAKIDSNDTRKDTKETAESEVKDDKGNVKKVEASIEQKHSRTINASLNVYDLKNKNVAFSGQLAKTREEVRSYKPDGLRGVLSLVNTIKGEEMDKTYPYPEAPSTRVVLAEIFEGFAENFPKE